MSLAKSLLTALSLSFLSAAALAQSYAPTPPPMISAAPKKTAAPEIAQAANQYSIGDPTDEEQMHLELINRARADASAEALRLIALAAVNKDVSGQMTFWQVDTNLLKAQFATNPPVAPLSMNAKLIQSARGHSQFQFDNAVQTHTGANGSTLSDRVNAVGYLWSNLGENVFAKATSVEHGHAGFEVDWGPNTNSLGQQVGIGGMQSPPGHRNSIHSGVFNEIGVGIVDGMNTVGTNTVGPQVVTEDFGKSQSPTTFITGVAYYDINGNNFYDLGEGLPGVQVTVDGVTTFAVTSTSGGYSVPVPTNRAYVVHFSGNGISDLTQVVSVGAVNSKLDFTPTYVQPVVTSGPASAFVGTDNIYHIAPLPGATGYRARITQIAPIPLEGAEGALDELTITAFGGYPFVSTARHASGAKSFHLGQMLDGDNLDAQIIEFNQPIQVFAGARVDFKSMMAVAGDGQFAEFQVSDDNGATWTTLWSQFGADVAGEETQFSAKSASLAAYEGKTIRARFIFDVNGNAYVLPDSSDGNFVHVGWYLDDISFVNAQSLISASESDVFAQPTFIFNPTATGNYLLEFQSIVGARTYAYGAGQQVTALAQPPSGSFVNDVTVTATTVTLHFTVSLGALKSFVLVSSPNVTGPFQAEIAGVTFSGPDQGRYTITAPRNGGDRFYTALLQF